MFAFIGWMGEEGVGLVMEEHKHTHTRTEHEPCVYEYFIRS